MEFHHFFPFPTEIQNKILGLVISQNLIVTMGRGTVSREDLNIIHVPVLRSVALPILASRAKLHAALSTVPFLKYTINHVLPMIKSLSIRSDEFSNGVKPFNLDAAQNMLGNLHFKVVPLLPRLQSLEIEINLGYTHIPHLDLTRLVLGRRSKDPVKRYKTLTSFVHYSDAITSGYFKSTKYRARRVFTLINLPASANIEIEKELTTEVKPTYAHCRIGEIELDLIGYEYTRLNGELACCHCFEQPVDLELISHKNYCATCYMSVYCSISCWRASHYTLKSHLFHSCAFETVGTDEKALKGHTVTKDTKVWGSPDMFITVWERKETSTKVNGVVKSRERCRWGQ